MPQPETEHMSDNNFQEATQLFEVNNDVDM